MVNKIFACVIAGINASLIYHCINTPDNIYTYRIVKMTKLLTKQAIYGMLLNIHLNSVAYKYPQPNDVQQ